MQERVAIVTGGARGMGAAHATALVERGVRVVVADVLDDEGQATVEALGDRAVYVHVDVRSPQDWQAAVEAADGLGGTLDILVNNAGINPYVPLEEVTPELWDSVLGVNLTGTWLGMETVIPSMKAAGGGAIVNVSSMGGLVAVNPLWAYTASKWAVRGLTKAAAIELGPWGITVNSIHPGFIRTPMLADADHNVLSGTVPLRRIGEPDEVAKLVVFLVESGTYCSGSEYAIDGGVLAGTSVVGT
ncbi:SDR family NAD(P)-dependent oxidoreductase [Streptomyces sp. NPDC020951]|uniref:SDR family NAD(P)-dependent oxidoreductase n=1 Tax=Streptomyces sp. NPDC020951 TaxID=3365104 RepID=UPI00379072A9